MREYSEKMTTDVKAGSFEHIAACCGIGVNSVLKRAMESESTDNISVVLLVFENFRRVLSQFETTVTH